MASDGKFVKQGLDKCRDDAARDANLKELRWMPGEMRVSLFAQGLMTPHPISWNRLE